MFLQRLLPRKILGIDIGSSVIKMVELSGWREKRKLENYGEMKIETTHRKPFRIFEKKTLSLSNKEIAEAINAIKEEANIKTNQCVFSIPDFSSFFTNFELPPMSRQELSQAVVYEARQHVPLPLGEVTLDWELIEGEVSDQKDKKLKILLVAIPNEVINQYKEIAKLTELKLLALEAEVFGLVRALIPENEKATLAIVDIGAQSTTCSIIDNRILKLSHSFDLAGDNLTEKIVKTLAVDYQTAEKLKEKYGLTEIPLPQISKNSSGKNLKEILVPLVDLILKEVKITISNFFQLENKEVEKFILAGGTALLAGFKEYFENSLKKETIIANPFANLIYPSTLEETLKEIGPSYAIAVGMALRGFIK